MHLAHRDPMPSAFAFQQGEHGSLELIAFAIPFFGIGEGLVEKKYLSYQIFIELYRLL
ncbi:MAG: hypothetical protein ACFFD2_19600 [Promethearchaeota archaeon]